MDWELWKPKYEKIVEKLGLDESEDRRAAEILDSLISKMNLSELKRIVDEEECLVFGAGPSLETDLRKIDEVGWFDKILISVDGATSAVLDFEVPDIIVTDLDGNINDQITAWEKGSWMVIHGHGDNTEKIRNLVPKFNERIIGTMQVDKPSTLYNFGGFTDGDRAAFMAHELGASKIFLAGMDLGKEIGKYTGKTEKENKLKKLKICKYLLSWLASEFNANLINITTNGEDIPEVPRESPRDYSNADS